MQVFAICAERLRPTASSAIPSSREWDKRVPAPNNGLFTFIAFGVRRLVYPERSRRAAAFLPSEIQPAQGLAESRRIPPAFSSASSVSTATQEMAMPTFRSVVRTNLTLRSEEHTSEL